jgi:hypothetical protein
MDYEKMKALMEASREESAVQRNPDRKYNTLRAMATHLLHINSRARPYSSEALG